MRGCRGDAEAVQQVLADLGIRWDGSLIEEDTSPPRRPPEGACTDDLLSRKPGFLLSAMHSRSFRWLSASTLVFLFLVFFFIEKTDFADFMCYGIYGEEGGERGTLFVCLFAKTISHGH
jgi:hypothetical protein